jgi:hypothetical protein
MNLRLLVVLSVLFLTACGTRIAKDDSPASDLDALAANVRKTTSRTLLANGKEYCAELARTEDEQDDCMGDLEDALYNSNRKGERTLQTVEAFIRRERLRRNPCNALQRAVLSRCQEGKNSATRP